MGCKPINLSDPGRWQSLKLLCLGLVSCTLAYMVVSFMLRPSPSISLSADKVENGVGGDGLVSERKNGDECCRGLPNLELWGCKAMCSGNDGPCSCDSWVFCGDKKACGWKVGECWLKKQKDSLAPEKQDAGDKVMWTSGLVFGKGEGIIGLETEHGTLRMKASYGPPFALIQGTLEAQGFKFKQLPTEVCLAIRRGAVAWIGSGTEFFISLANHGGWKRSYTVFGSVLPQDMEIAEKIAQFPTNPDVWNNVNVSVLQNPVPLSIRRIRSSDDVARRYD